LFLGAFAASLPAQVKPPPLNTAISTSGSGVNLLKKANLIWPTIAGLEDTLEASADLRVWAPLLPPQLGTGQSTQVNVRSWNPNSGTIPILGPQPVSETFLIYRANATTAFARWRDTDTRLFYMKALPTAWASLNAPPVVQSTISAQATQFTLFWAPIIGETLATSSTFSAKATAAFTALESQLALTQSTITAGASAAPLPPVAVSSSAAKYFRVRRASLDSDGDRLNDDLEYAWSVTSPFQADTNANGTKDLVEDNDGDGSNNLAEAAQGRAGNIADQLKAPKNGYEVLTVNGIAAEYETLTFRCYPGVNHPWRYRLRKVGATSGMGLSIASLMVGTPVKNDDGTETVKVRSDTPAPIPHGPATLSLLCLEPWPPAALRDATVTLSNLKAHHEACMDALLPTGDIGGQIFDSYDRQGPASWARWSWTNAIDFTGVAWDDYRHGGRPAESACEAVLVSRQHVLMPRHYIAQGGIGWDGGAYGRQRIPGSRITFHDRAGNRLERRLVKIGWSYLPSGIEPDLNRRILYSDLRSTIWSDPNPVSEYDKVNRYVNDLCVGLLDEPLPDGFHVFRTLPLKTTSGNHISYGDNNRLGMARLIQTYRERGCVMFRLSSIGIATNNMIGVLGPMIGLDNQSEEFSSGSSIFTYDNIALGEPAQPNYLDLPPRSEAVARNQMLSGDSGGLCLILFKGEPILLGVQSQGGYFGRTKHSFLSSPINYFIINDLLLKIGGIPATLQSISL
jgi:hypothetical protein